MSSDLTLLEPAFREKVEALLTACTAQGVEMRPYDTLRTPVAQAKLWRQSRSREQVNAAIARLEREGAPYLAACLAAAGPSTGRHVTNALPGLSWHQWGEAADAVWIVGGKAEWSTTKKVNGRNGYRIYAAEAVRLGLEAGGLWASLKDWPHVQLRAASNPGRLYALPAIDDAMRERYGDPPPVPERKAALPAAATAGVPDGWDEEYTERYATLRVRPERVALVRSLAAKVLAQKDRYAAAGASHSVPWFVVGALHLLEAGLRFDRHLHNGDPLTSRTVHVPAGRPAKGAPPFTWEESAADALVYDGLHRVGTWSLPRTLHALERFNGLGYRRRGVPTPYLWSFSTHYTKGKFTADGTYDPNAVSQQCGAAVLLHQLEAGGALPAWPAG